MTEQEKPGIPWWGADADWAAKMDAWTAKAGTAEIVLTRAEERELEREGEEIRRYLLARLYEAEAMPSTPNDVEALLATAMATEAAAKRAWAAWADSVANLDEVWPAGAGPVPDSATEGARG